MNTNGSTKIMIVDAYEHIRFSLERYFGTFHPEIVVIGGAVSVIEAVQACHTLKPDVILLDVPFSEIRDFSKAISRLRELHKIKIIFWSSFIDADIRSYMKEFQPDLLLFKETSPARLANEIMKVVQRDAEFHLA